MTSVLVVGSAGAMGSLLVGLLDQVTDVEVTAVDLVSAPQPTLGRELIGNIESISPDLAAVLSTVDVVMLALPEGVAERAAAEVFATVRSTALVVDTLSVKTGWFSKVAAHLQGTEPRPEVLSINPMFAPALGFPGRGVAVVSVHDGPRSGWFRDLLGRWGADLIVMEPDEHDRFMASIQAATHAAVLAFGLAMADLGHDLDRLWPALTPPHRTMLALAARICAGDAHVYHDIQHANPYAAPARQAVMDGLRSLSSASEHESPAAFGELLERVADSLASHRSDLERHCVTLFDLK